MITAALETVPEETGPGYGLKINTAEILFGPRKNTTWKFIERKFGVISLFQCLFLSSFNTHDG
jgi:hypothetical protein